MNDFHGLSFDDRASLLLSLNIGNRTSYDRPLSPLEVALLLEKALTRTTKKELAQELNLADTSMITRLTSILNFEEDIRSLIGWGRKPGQVAMAVALEGGISRLKPVRIRRIVLEAAMKYNFSKKEAQTVGQLYKREFGSVEECIEECLKSRPKIVHNEVFIGAIIDENLKIKLSKISPQTRNELFSNALKIIYPEMRTIGVKLNTNHYSFVVSKKWANFVKNKKEELSREEAICKTLMELLL